MPEAAEQKKPAPESSGTDLGDEYLFYDKDGDRVHVLNGTAREIFLLCNGEHTEAEIVEKFRSKYGLDEETARNDALTMLRSLYDLGLVRA